ncbi:unnamed protein product [Gordionus sp. m RMFG-2023]
MVDRSVLSDDTFSILAFSMLVSMLISMLVFSMLVFSMFAVSDLLKEMNEKLDNEIKQIDPQGCELGFKLRFPLSTLLCVGIYNFAFRLSIEWNTSAEKRIPTTVSKSAPNAVSKWTPTAVSKWTPTAISDWAQTANPTGPQPPKNLLPKPGLRKTRHKHTCSIMLLNSEETFIAVLKSKYNETRVQTLNYESQTDAAIAKIKSVSEFSKGLIKDLIPLGSLDSGTKVVLVDTLYFKSNWGIPFQPELTSVKAFTRDDGKLEEVKMMFGTNEAQYGETQLKKIEDRPSSIPDQKIKILRIQYANPNLAMFFVLLEQKGLPNLIKVLSFESLTSLIKTAKKTLVDITLPIFKTSFDVTLSDTLKNLGRNIFKESADFSGLTGTSSG